LKTNTRKDTLTILAFKLEKQGRSSVKSTKSIATALAAVLTLSPTIASSQAASNTKALQFYGDLLAVNEVCKTRNIDHSRVIEEYLSSKVALLERVAQDSSLPPEARSEVRAVLDKTRRKDIDKAAFDAGKAEIAALSAEGQLDACRMIPQAVENELAKDMVASKLQGMRAKP
jgi:hypothetical protein